MILKKEKGFSIFNLLATMSLIAILATTAISDLKKIKTPIHDAAVQTDHFLKLAKANAISQTRFIIIKPLGTQNLQASSSTSCDGPLTVISNLGLKIKSPAKFADTSWTVCFTPRGLSSDNVSFVINGDGVNSRTIEVALGGGTNITG